MIIHTADWHLFAHRAFSTIAEPNINSRLKEELFVLSQLIEFVQQRRQDIEALIIEGDVFGGLGKHPRDTISKDVLNSGHWILKEISKSVPIFVIPGNHDLHKGATILRVFQDIPNLTLFTKPSEVTFSPGKHLFVPYPPGHQKDKSTWNRWVTGGNQWLITHMGFLEADMGFDDTEAVTIPKYPFIVTGHYHTHKMVQNVLYVGTPYQLSFSDEGKTCGFVVVEREDNGRWGFRQTPMSGPQFVTVNVNTQEEYDAWYQGRDNRFYYRVILHSRSINVWGEQSYRSEIIPMATESVDLPGNDGFSISSVTKSMKDWVAALPDGVDRDRVLHTGEEIWKRLS